MSNNHNNNHDQNNNAAKHVSVKRDWKIYVSLFLYALLGLAIGYAIARGVLYFVNRSKITSVKVIDSTKMSTKDFTGSVSANFEGEQKAELNFKTNSDLIVTQGAGAKAKYFYITNASGTNVATVYMSYEGGRGFSPAEYAKDVIGKFVPGLSALANVSYASTTWSYTSSASSEWHIAPSKNNQWLVIVENKKANHDALTSVYETLNVK